NVFLNIYRKSSFFYLIHPLTYLRPACITIGFSFQTKTAEDQNGEESMNGRGDNSEDPDNYTGYTEEELAFMQRLQENRNSSEGTSQLKNENAAGTAEGGEGEPPCTHSDHPSSTPPDSVREDISAKLNSMFATLWRGSQVFINPQPPPPPVEQLQRQQACCQASERSSSLGPLSPQSAPPSLCPPTGTEERINLLSRKSDEVLFLKQKVSDLEAQIAQLTELIRTQGDVMSQLSDTIERLQQQYRTLSPTTSQVNNTATNNDGSEQ
ncbi:unnamed protein product, partial [Hymenolepis diminuta]